MPDEPIRAQPMRPNRLLEEMVVNVHYTAPYTGPPQPIVKDTRCNLSTRTIRSGPSDSVTVACGPVAMPPSLVRTSLCHVRCDPPCESQERHGACKHGECPRLAAISVRDKAYDAWHSTTVQATGTLRYDKAAEQQKAAELAAAAASLAEYPVAVCLKLKAIDHTKSSEWRQRHVCICDATVGEMEMVLRARNAAQQVRHREYDEKWDKFHANRKRALKAARTRRRRKKPKKPKAFQSHEPCVTEKLWESSTSESEFVTASESDVCEEL